MNQAIPRSTAAERQAYFQSRHHLPGVRSTAGFYRDTMRPSQNSSASDASCVLIVPVPSGLSASPPCVGAKNPCRAYGARGFWGAVTQPFGLG
jgi:hypothetical protein